jgi:hypothetical protein
MDCLGGFAPLLGDSCLLSKPRQFHVIVLSPKWSEVNGIEFNPGMPSVIGRTVGQSDHQLRRVSLFTKHAV